MIPTQFALAVASRLSACSTITEQSIMLTQIMADARYDACIETANQLAAELREARFTDDMPMATWPHAQRFASNICKQYAQKLQCATEKTPKESAVITLDDISAVHVTRGARGFWRHHRFPAFRPEESELRQRWLKMNRLDTCGTLLVPPESIQDEFEDHGNMDCTFWTVVRPSGDKWFLLAIESTSSGPMAIWAARV